MAEKLSTLKKKYAQMSERQLSEEMAKNLVQVARLDEQIRLLTESIKTSTEQIAHYQKVLFDLLISAIVIFGAIIGFKLLQIYLSFRKFISWVDAGAQSTTVWPTGGFGTAMAIYYPITAGWFGFADPYLPMAAYLTWSQFGSTPLPLNGNQTVNDSAGYVLGLMYNFAVLGGKPLNSGSMCTNAGDGNIPVFEIICCAWGNSNEAPPCTNAYCDTSLTTGDYITIGMAGLSGGSQGAFLGHMTGGGPGSAIGMIAMAGIQSILSYF